MYYYEVAFFGKPNVLLTYQSENLYSLGTKVQVRLAQHKSTGILWNTPEKPSFSGKISPILSQIEEDFHLPSLDREFYEFCSRYYHADLSVVLKNAFPAHLQKSTAITDQEKNRDKLFFSCDLDQKHLIPNEEQEKFINSFPLSGYHAHLLEGITGSGKTLCYAKIISLILKKNPSSNILVLVPEISLVQNMCRQLWQLGLKKILPFHSQLSASAKALTFKISPKLSGTILVTTRSGIFLPLAQIGALIIDEEHDSSYKEENKTEAFLGFRHFFPYHARDLALKKAHLFQVPALLGTATPCIQTFENVKKGNFQHSQLLTRALKVQLPKIELLPSSGSTWKNPLCPRVLLAIKETLDQKKQVLIYLNQRGYIPSVYCQGCSETLRCTHCSSRLVIHSDQKHAHCHKCCKKVLFSPQCPTCQEPWIFCGFGTQRLSEYLSEVFPMAPLTIVDTDHMTSASKMQKTIEKICSETTGLIVGTQMVCKGHNWPHVALSVVLIGSYQLEYALDEQVAQNIVQVAGRSGRYEQGKALMPYPLDKTIPKSLSCLLDGHYEQWIGHYSQNLGSHSQDKFAKINLSVTQVNQALALLFPLIKNFSGHVIGPTLDYPAHIGKHWKIYLLVKTPSRQERKVILEQLIELICQNDIAKEDQISVDIDPLQAHSL